MRERLTRGETDTHKLGAKSLIEQLARQLSSPNKALEPSPTWAEKYRRKPARRGREARLFSKLAPFHIEPKKIF
jgi:hypothetical protein